MKKSLWKARTCYKHLAGELGTDLCERFIEIGWIENHFEGYPSITNKGMKGFEKLGIDIAQLNSKGKPTIRLCQDTSERKPHLAGKIGDLLLDYLLKEDWLENGGEARKINITPKGMESLKDIGIKN